MTIRVLIHRQEQHEPARGFLRAYMLTSGNQRGSNLIGSGIRQIEVAQSLVREKLKSEMANGLKVPEPKIEWVIEDWKTDAIRFKVEDGR